MPFSLTSDDIKANTFTFHKYFDYIVRLRGEQVVVAMQEIWTDFCQRVPHAACSWNMFNQHLHCIIYTSWLIIWATVALTAYEPKVILSNVSKHLAIASVSGNVKVWRVGGSVSMCCCTLAFLPLKV